MSHLKTRKLRISHYLAAGMSASPKVTMPCEGKLSIYSTGSFINCLLGDVGVTSYALGTAKLNIDGRK